MTTITDRIAAIEALRPAHLELTRLVREGHDLAALAPRIMEMSERNDAAKQALSSAVRELSPTASLINEADEGGGLLAEIVSGSFGLYDAIMERGYQPDPLMSEGKLMTIAEWDAYTDEKWSALLN